MAYGIINRCRRRSTPFFWIPVLLLATLVADLACTPFRPVADRRPNIILVMADDQGYGDMAYTGNRWVNTPNFDRAASSGLRFDRFYAAAPVCSPTRASILTGRNPNRTGVYQWGHRLRPQEITLAEILRASGYATGHFGKWHLGSVRASSPTNPGQNGFDYWASAPNYFDNDPVLSVNGRATAFSGESSEVTVREAITWIDEQATSDRPFLAVVWFGSPHDPHQSSDEFRKTYEKIDWQRETPGESEELIQRRIEFLGEIEGMDAAFGMLRSHLEETGLRDNTVLWYISDNGALPGVGSTGGFRGNKGSLYDGGLRVPAFVEWPGRIRTPRNTQILANSADIYPTVLDIAGVSIPKIPLDGITLAPLFNGNANGRPGGMGFWHRAVPGELVYADSLMRELLRAQADGRDLPAAEADFSAHEVTPENFLENVYAGETAWIDGDWKLYRSEREGKVSVELYNLKADPFETKNLSQEEPERADRLLSELTRWLESVKDSMKGRDY